MRIIRQVWEFKCSHCGEEYYLYSILRANDGKLILKLREKNRDLWGITSEEGEGLTKELSEVR